MATQTAPNTSPKTGKQDSHAPSFANFVKLTLRTGTQPESQFSESGTYWVRLRASLYLGKDEAGNYRPSKWFTVKAFAKKDDQAKTVLVDALAALNVGDRFTVSGRLDYVEFTRRDNTPGSEDVIIALKVEPFVATTQDDKFKEPAF